MINLRTVVLVAAIAAVLAVPETAADPGKAYRIGIRVGVISDPTDPSLGVDMLVPLRSGWSVDVGVDVVFASGDDQAILSADVLLDLDLAGATRAWVGGGPALVFNDPVPGSDDVGGAVGVLAGVGVPLSDGVLPYLQGKVLIADRTRVEVMVGVRF